MLLLILVQCTVISKKELCLNGMVREALRRERPFLERRVNQGCCSIGLDRGCICLNVFPCSACGALMTPVEAGVAGAGDTPAVYLCCGGMMAASAAVYASSYINYRLAAIDLISSRPETVCLGPQARTHFVLSRLILQDHLIRRL